MKARGVTILLATNECSLIGCDLLAVFEVEFTLTNQIKTGECNKSLLNIIKEEQIFQNETKQREQEGIKAEFQELFSTEKNKYSINFELKSNAQNQTEKLGWRPYKYKRLHNGIDGLFEKKITQRKETNNEKIFIKSKVFSVKEDKDVQIALNARHLNSLWKINTIP